MENSSPLNETVPTHPKRPECGVSIMEKGECSRGGWQKVVRSTPNALGHGPHMITQQEGYRARGIVRGGGIRHKDGKEGEKGDNRFGKLMREDPGDIQESHQVAAHNESARTEAAIKCPSTHSKKQRLEKGPRNVRIQKTNMDPNNRSQIALEKPNPTNSSLSQNQHQSTPLNNEDSHSTGPKENGNQQGTEKDMEITLTNSPTDSMDEALAGIPSNLLRRQTGEPMPVDVEGALNNTRMAVPPDPLDSSQPEQRLVEVARREERSILTRSGVRRQRSISRDRRDRSSEG